MERGRTLRSTDTVLWIGNEGIYVWDRRSGQESCIRFVGRGGGPIPYVPGFHDLWEDAGYYWEELRQTLGKSVWRKRRILLALPEDATGIETTALEDFVYAAMGGGLKRRRGLLTCCQSELLRGPSGSFVAVTRSCRCYCVALVTNGEVVERALLDAQESTRLDILGQIREFRSRHASGLLDSCYPQTEENRVLISVGTPVAFPKMVEALFS